MKWVHYTLIMCIVILSIVCPFSVSSSAAVSAWESPYMPVCPSYLTSGQLPFGADNTLVICCVPPSDNSISPAFRDSYYQWFFVYIDSTYDYFFIPQASSSKTFINIKSKAKIIRYYSTVHSTQPNWVLSEVGSYDSTGSGNFYLSNIDVGNSNFSIVSNFEPSYWGTSVSYAEEAGLIPLPSSFSGSLIDSYISAYPDSVKLAIDSISDNQVLLNQYYTSISGKLNSLSSDHIALYNQNSELQSQVSELQSQLAASSGEYQSALNQAQSEIESNANSAASQAVDDVNNAGEDMSDIDNDVDDVNSIVETLDSWIETLDDFADRIQNTAADVASALDNGTVLFNGFLGACPPIVLALFGFALVFLVVRKIIGR